jgi:hypothetical protein
MALPTNTSTILMFLGHSVLNDYEVSNRNGVVSMLWLSVAPEPTEQQIIDAGNDLTVVNGQTFSQWHAENGADATLTARKQAKDKADAVDQSTRALLQNANQRINYLTNRMIELQDRVQAMLDSVDVPSAMKADGLAVSISVTSTRTLPTAIQDYKDDIDSGAAD